MLDSMRGVWAPPPMKCRRWRGEQTADGIRYVQPKYDGWQLGFFMQGDPANGLCVFGRKREAHLELSHLPGVHKRPWYRRLEARMRPGDALLAEAYVPGRPASCVTTALRDPTVPLRLVGLAVPFVDGEPGPTRMDDARWRAEEWGVDDWPLTVAYTGQTREELAEYAAGWGCEGVVLKEDHLTGWYKLKLEDTVDLVCTGVKTAEVGTEYHGLAASLLGSVYDAGGALREVARVPGLSVEERTESLETAVGRVFEARYQYVGAGGRLRHPRFLRWRDDKPAAECTDDQLGQLRKETQ